MHSQRHLLVVSQGKPKHVPAQIATAYSLMELKPTTVLAFVERSDNHVEEFGENIEVIWKPDATAIVVHVKTEALNLVYRVDY